MSGHAHQSPAEIRAKLNHPVIDGDGHWVEYDPVFAEQMRKVGGDKAADGFLAAMGATRDALDARCRGAHAAGGWRCRASGRARPATRYDRATAMMPQLLYDRLDEIGSDFAIVYPTAGLRLPRISDDETRRAVIRAYNIVSAGYFKRPQRPDDPGRDHPDAHAGRGDRRARIRHQATGLEGRHVRQRPAAQGAGGRRPTTRTPTASRSGTRCSASTASTTTTRSGRSAVEVEHRADLPQHRQQPGAAQLADQLHLQPYRPFRRCRPCRRQGHLPRRRHPALPGAALCLPRRRRRLGLAVVRRSDRALGAAQRQGARKHAARTSSTASC